MSPQRFWRKCSCVKPFNLDKYRRVNIVIHEGKEAPLALAHNYEWADKFCPMCRGNGVIEEEVSGRIDVEAMKRDFVKGLARPI